MLTCVRTDVEATTAPSKVGPVKFRSAPASRPATRVRRTALGPVESDSSKLDRKAGCLPFYSQAYSQAAWYMATMFSTGMSVIRCCEGAMVKPP